MLGLLINDAIYMEHIFCALKLLVMVCTYLLFYVMSGQYGSHGTLGKEMLSESKLKDLGMVMFTYYLIALDRNMRIALFLFYFNLNDRDCSTICKLCILYLLMVCWHVIVSLIQFYMHST
jgi:hypothetical protein